MVFGDIKFGNMEFCNVEFGNMEFANIEFENKEVGNTEFDWTEGTNTDRYWVCKDTVLKTEHFQTIFALVYTYYTYIIYGKN